MAGFTGRRETGQWNGGWSKSRKYRTGHLFTNYSNHTPDTSRRYFTVGSGSYGSGAYNCPLLEVDVQNYYYTFGASVYTHTLSYNNRTGSGHMGIRQYDADGNTAYYYMCGDYGKTTLTRAASPGDTTIYIASGSGWYEGTSAGNCYATFFPATDPKYSTPYYYSRRTQRYVNDGNAVTDIGGGEWSVTLTGGLPNWGHALPVGTPVGNGRGSNANWYIVTGNTNFNNLNKWRTFRSTARKGYRYDGAAGGGGGFINGIKYVRFLHLRNYTYRSEQAGAAAQYYITNIMAIRRPDGVQPSVELFQRGLPGPFY